MFQAKTAEEALRYLTHSVNRGLFTCSRCVKKNDVTARPAPGTKASSCQRCGCAVVKGQAWWIVPSFKVAAA